MRSLAIISLLATFFGTGCVGFSPSPTHWTEEQVRTFQVDGAGATELLAATHNGRIEVRAHADGSRQVDVVARVKAGGQGPEDAQACLDAIHLEVDRVDERVQAGWKWSNRRRGWGARVTLEITAPAELALTATTHNGGIDVAGMQNSTRVTSHNGQISTQGCRGDLHLSTHNGGIRAEGTGPEVRVATHNGSVEVHLAEASALHGSITTHNGPVKVWLPTEGPIRVVCRTYNGAIETESRFDHTRVDRRRFEGTRGEPRESLSISTHNGGIRLQP